MSATPNKIVIPVDFGEQSMIALHQGSRLAKMINADVTLVYVIESQGLFSRSNSIQDEEMKKEIGAKLDELCAGLKKDGINTEKVIAHGSVYDKVTEVAEMLNAKFIVMGTSGRNASGVRRRFIGSNALRVVRESKVPVITIKGKAHRDGCKNIVLPLDLTKETREKVARAIDFAKMYGADIRIVSVLFTTDEFIVNRLTRQLSQVKAFIEKGGVRCTAEIIKGIKGEESLSQIIIDYSNKVEGDLLMIMTQQEQEITELFVGSAAQEIINRSDIPVLSIIPSPKKDLSEFLPY
ncbi:MAG TPA: universal stress protein [Bacteroidia bacterium]|jgi:nucleotide-binding universal stress UspA family protein|nr:universal stress protein [Bacteroidia bacterium]